MVIIRDLTLPGLVREGCEAVVLDSRYVRIDADALHLFAREMNEAPVSPSASWDSWHYAGDSHIGGPLTAQYVFVLDCLNFCFWPSDSGCEYDALAQGLRTALLADPNALSAEILSGATAATVASWVAKPHTLPFLETRAARVRELGYALSKPPYDGYAANVVTAARGSASKLAALVAEMCPGFRDEAVYVGASGGSDSGAPRLVPFYKRAQILAGDIWVAYGKQQVTAATTTSTSTPTTTPELGAFYDIDNLTAFADYRLPQLLRARGVLIYTQDLADAVDNKVELLHGSPQEVEIRANTVISVERLKKEIMVMASNTTKKLLNSVELDHSLWHIGETLAAQGKLAPHHRVRTVFY